MKSFSEIFEKNSALIIGFLLMGLILSFFWPISSFSFINFDDPIYVTQNTNVLNGLHWEGFKWAWSTNTIGHWHPLTWLAHMLDVSIFGPQNAGGHHLSNLFLYSLCVLGVFFLFLKLNIDRQWAALACLFFALHPMRLESFVWISEKKDVLSFLFGITAILAYLREKTIQRKIFFSSLLLLLSLLSKPTFFSLGCVLFLYEFCLGAPQSIKGKIFSLWPPFLLGFASSALVLMTQKSVGALNQVDLWQRIQGMLASYSMYLQSFFLPLENSIFYVRYTPSLLLSIGTFILITALSVLVFLRRKKFPLACFSWFWFLLATLPLSGIVSIGGQMYADRWTLVPHLALCLFCVSFLSHWKPQKVFVGISIIAIAAMIFVTNQRIPYWQNSETIFHAALNQNPDNFMAHTNLGVFLEENGQYPEAESHYKRAVDLNPTWPPALNNLGLVFANQMKQQAAKYIFERALELNPNLSSARHNLQIIEEQQFSKNLHNLSESDLRLMQRVFPQMNITRKK